MKADSLEARIGARIFWSAYDPLDLASNSIDPLGFARGYLALADLFLPGLTTVTRTPRYVSMLCAAIRVAEDSFPHAGFPVPAKVRQERLDAVKSFERAWALACGLAAQAVGERRVPG